MNTIAERVTLIIDSQGIKRNAIPKRGGPSRPTLYRIENEPDYQPEESTLDRLADAIGVARDWLKTGEGPMYVSPLEAYARSPISGADGAAEAHEGYTAQDGRASIDVALLQRAIQEALQAAPGELPERLAQAISDAYHTAMRTRRLITAWSSVRIRVGPPETPVTIRFRAFLLPRSDHAWCICL